MPGIRNRAIRRWNSESERLAGPALVSLKVVAEPDADGDGFGDESQDQCPQSAATQGACPPPAAGSGIIALKGKPKLEGNVVAVKLTTSVATKLTAIGSIRGKRAAKQRLANRPRKRKLRW